MQTYNLIRYYVSANRNEKCIINEDKNCMDLLCQYNPWHILVFPYWVVFNEKVIILVSYLLKYHDKNTIFESFVLKFIYLWSLHRGLSKIDYNYNNLIKDAVKQMCVLAFFLSPDINKFLLNNSP